MAFEVAGKRVLITGAPSGIDAYIAGAAGCASCQGTAMKALVFGVRPEPFEIPDGANLLTKNFGSSPVALRQVPDPALLHDDWVITRPRLTGICGSDSKQILLDFGEGDADNAMAAFCSFPQVMGHEVVADVVELGPEARGLQLGQRVVLNPWLSCGPRGIEPPCPACANGDYSLCWSFCDGDIKPGIHTGVSADVTGGYAELMPAHDSMLFPVPDSVPDELAVLRRSVFGVAARHHPPPAAALGPGAGLRRRLIGVVRVSDPASALSGRGGRGGGPIRRAGRAGSPFRRLDCPGARAAAGGHRKVGRLGRRPVMAAAARAADGLPPALSTLSTTPSGSRRRSRSVSGSWPRGGTLVKAGVHAPGRWEWSPLYFKEISWVGSNAFGVEEVDGRRQHAIAHYLDLVVDGRIDLRPMLTHTFRLDRWRDAFLAIANQADSGAVKVAFDQR